jgi:putative aldouronate transport system permease protein
MVKKASAGQWLFDFLVAAFFAALSALFLYPLIYEIAVFLLRRGRAVPPRGLLFYPLEFTVQAYQIVLKNQYVASGFQNTLFVLIIGLAFNLILTSIGAYFLSRRGVLLFRRLCFTSSPPCIFSGGPDPLLADGAQHWGCTTACGR